MAERTDIQSTPADQFAIFNIQFFAAEPERIRPGGFVIISAIA